MSVVLDQRPSLLTPRVRLPVFVRMTHRYHAAVRLLGDVHAGRVAGAFSRRPAGLGFAADVSEVSRFPALALLSMLPSAHFNDAGVRVVCFRSSIPHPAYTPVYASLRPSR
jgi:hypothetical protein